MKTSAALLIAMLATSAWAKDRIWQDGSLLDTRSNKYFPGIDSSGEADRAPSSRMFSDTSTAQTNTIYDRYVVESGDAVYLVERGRFKSAKPSLLRPYLSIKFAVDKKKVWLLDEEGRELETTVLKRVDKDVARPSFTAGLPAR
jgi:hypothetical protein